MEEYVEKIGISHAIQAGFDDIFSRSTLPKNPFPIFIQKFKFREIEKVLQLTQEIDGEQSQPDPEVQRSSQHPAIWYPAANQHSDASVPYSTKCLANQICVPSFSRLRELVEDILGCERGFTNATPRHAQVKTSTAILLPTLLYGSGLPFGHEISIATEYMVEGDKFERAFNLFARGILTDVLATTSSTQLFLHSIHTFAPARKKGDDPSEKIWSIEEVEKSRNNFVSTVKAAAVSKSNVYTEMIFLQQKPNSKGFVPWLVRRFYRLHVVNSSGKWRSFAPQPFASVAIGAFFTEEEAVQYIKIFSPSWSMIEESNSENLRQVLRPFAKEFWDKAEEEKLRVQIYSLYETCWILSLLLGKEGHSLLIQKLLKSGFVGSVAILHRQCQLLLLCLAYASCLVSNIKHKYSRKSVSEGNQQLSRRSSRTSGIGQKLSELNDLGQLYEIIKSIHSAYDDWASQVHAMLAQRAHSDVIWFGSHIKEVVDSLRYDGTVSVSLSDMALVHLRLSPIQKNEPLNLHQLQNLEASIQEVESSLKKAEWLLEMLLSCVSEQAACFLETMDKKDVEDGNAPKTLESLLEIAQKEFSDNQTEEVPKQKRKWGFRRKTVIQEVQAVNVCEEEGWNLKEEVISTIQRDYLPKNAALEGTLFRYATDTRIDEILQSVMTKVLLGPLTDNPYPDLTFHLQVQSLWFHLWTESDRDILRRISNEDSDHFERIDGSLYSLSTPDNSSAIFGHFQVLKFVNAEYIVKLFSYLPDFQSSALFDAQQDDAVAISIATGIACDSCLYGNIRSNCIPMDIDLQVFFILELDLEAERMKALLAFAKYVATLFELLRDRSTNIPLWLIVGSKKILLKSSFEEIQGLVLRFVKAGGKTVELHFLLHLPIIPSFDQNSASEEAAPGQGQMFAICKLHLDVLLSQQISTQASSRSDVQSPFLKQCLFMDQQGAATVWQLQDQIADRTQRAEQGNQNEELYIDIVRRLFWKNIMKVKESEAEILQCNQVASLLCRLESGIHGILKFALRSLHIGRLLINELDEHAASNLPLDPINQRKPSSSDVVETSLVCHLFNAFGALRDMMNLCFQQMNLMGTIGNHNVKHVLHCQIQRLRTDLTEKSIVDHKDYRDFVNTAQEMIHFCQGIIDGNVTEYCVMIGNRNLLKDLRTMTANDDFVHYFNN